MFAEETVWPAVPVRAAAAKPVSHRDRHGGRGGAQSICVFGCEIGGRWNASAMPEQPGPGAGGVCSPQRSSRLSAVWYREHESSASPGRVMVLAHVHSSAGFPCSDGDGPKAGSGIAARKGPCNFFSSSSTGLNTDTTRVAKAAHTPQGGRRWKLSRSCQPSPCCRQRANKQQLTPLWHVWVQSQPTMRQSLDLGRWLGCGVHWVCCSNRRGSGGQCLMRVGRLATKKPRCVRRRPRTPRWT